MDNQIYGIVYLAINHANNKWYVGQTARTLARRKVEHANHAKYEKTPFARAILKYGVESFSWHRVHDCYSADDLNYWEKYFVELFDVTNNATGYNLMAGGLGNVHSEESIQKMREAKIGEKNSFYGKTHTDEARRKISESKKNLSDETRKKMSESAKKRGMDHLRGRVVSAETRKRLSEAKTGIKLPPRSAEHCRKLSEAAKARHARR